MPFTPLTDYHSYNHVPVAGAVWIHPGNGNAYCCACEKDASKRQDLSVYRLRRGAPAWELVKRYEGTSADSVGQITMGGAAIEQDGNMLVVTSLTIPNVPKVTFEGFQGVWIREFNIDEPWSLQASDSRVDALTAQLGTLGQQLAQLEARIGAQPPTPAADGSLILHPQGDEGGQLAWAPGGTRTRWWFADSYQDVLRIFSEGVVVAEFRPDGLYAMGADGGLRKV